MTFAEITLATRKQLKLTQTVFAGLLGVERKTVLRWERGLAVPVHRSAVEMQFYALKHIPSVTDLTLQEAVQLIQSATPRAEQQRADREPVAQSH